MDKWRTPEANEYRKLYRTKHWAKLRAMVLHRDQYKCQHKGCGAFLKQGTRSPRSAVVHHIKPHKGNLDLFYDINNLQAVCWSCHSGDIQSIETKGYDTAIGDNGWPIDQNHPANKQQNT